MKPKSEKNKNEVLEGRNLSNMLKEARQGKNLSLERLSDLTKIQVYHLEAIESGHFDKLPPMVYRDGILKRLAKVLEISEDVILDTYGKENIPADNYGAGSIVAPKKNFHFILTPKKLILFLGGLFLASVSFYLWYQLGFLIGPPTLTVEPREDIIIESDSVMISGVTDSRVDLTINGESVYVASNGSFSKNIQLAEGLNVIEISAINNFGKINRIIRNIFKKQQTNI